MSRYVARLLIAVQRVDIWPVAVRRRMLRWAGVTIESGGLIEPGVTFVNTPLTLGRGVYTNCGCFLDAKGGLTLGDRVHLGPGVYLVTSTHAVGSTDCRAGLSSASPIVVGEGSWIGCGTRVLAGVSIGAVVVVGAGAVVLTDLAPNALSAGVPATRRKSLPLQRGEV